MREPKKGNLPGSWTLILLMFLSGTAGKVAAQVPTDTPTVTATPTCDACTTPTWRIQSGSLLGYVQGPQGVAQDGSHVYVSDIYNHRVETFDLSGTALGSTDMATTLNSAMGLALGNSNTRLFVVNNFSNEVFLLDLSTPSSPTYLASFGSGVLSQPVAVTVDDHGDVLVSDSTSVRKFRLSGLTATLVATLGTPGATGTASGMFYNPYGVLADGNYVYVADTRNDRIQRWVRAASSGPGLDSYSPDASVPNATIYTEPTDTYPFAMAFGAGHRYLYLAANNANLYQVFDTFPSPWRLVDTCASGLLYQPSGIAVDPSGNIYISSFANNYFFKFGPACYDADQPPIDTPTPSYQGANPPDPGVCFIYPSPVRGDHATLSYYMRGPGQVEIKVWNSMASLVGRFSDSKPVGIQITPLGLTGLASGVYFYDVTLRYDSGQVEKIPPHKFAVIH